MNNIEQVQIFVDNPPLLVAAIAVLLVVLVLKGFALWRAGRNNHTGWFIALFILNTAGILEIIYLLTAGKKKR